MRFGFVLSTAFCVVQRSKATLTQYSAAESTGEHLSKIDPHTPGCHQLVSPKYNTPCVYESTCLTGLGDVSHCDAEIVAWIKTVYDNSRHYVVFNLPEHIEPGPSWDKTHASGCAMLLAVFRLDFDTLISTSPEPAGSCDNLGINSFLKYPSQMASVIQLYYYVPGTQEILKGIFYTRDQFQSTIMHLHQLQAGTENEEEFKRFLVNHFIFSSLRHAYRPSPDDVKQHSAAVENLVDNYVYSTDWTKDPVDILQHDYRADLLGAFMDAVVRYNRNQKVPTADFVNGRYILSDSTLETFIPAKFCPFETILDDAYPIWNRMWNSGGDAYGFAESVVHVGMVASALRDLELDGEADAAEAWLKSKLNYHYSEEGMNALLSHLTATDQLKRQAMIYVVQNYLKQNHWATEPQSHDVGGSKEYRKYHDQRKLCAARSVALLSKMKVAHDNERPSESFTKAVSEITAMFAAAKAAYTSRVGNKLIENQALRPSNVVASMGEIVESATKLMASPEFGF